MPKFTLKEEDKINVEKCIDRVMKRGSGYYATYTTLWSGVQLKDGKIFDANNTACHAELGYRTTPDLKYIVSRIQWKTPYEGKKGEIAEAYLDWLVRTSPYAKCFTYLKTGKECIKRGVVVAKTDRVPANLMAGGLIAARQLTEHNSIAEAWYRLVQLGVHPDIAYCHAHTVIINAAGVDTETGYHGHTSWYSTNTKEAVLNFRRHNIVTKLPSYNSKRNKSPHQRGYSPQALSWGGAGNGQTLANLIRDAKLIAEGKKVVKNNPFANAGALRSHVDTDKFFAAWAPLLIKEYGEDNEK